LSLVVEVHSPILTRVKSEMIFFFLTVLFFCFLFVFGSTGV
jgi:hypothetical protein